MIQIREGTLLLRKNFVSLANVYTFFVESNLLKDQRTPDNSESDLIAFLLTDLILHFIRSPMYLEELYCILSSQISLS